MSDLFGNHIVGFSKKAAQLCVMYVFYNTTITVKEKH